MLKPLLESIADVCETENMRFIATNSSGDQMRNTYGVAGSLLAGPDGKALGHALGTMHAFHNNPEDFCTVGQIFKEHMTTHQRSRLCFQIRAVLLNMDDNPGASFIIMAMLFNEPLKRAVLQKVKTFITNEMKMRQVGPYFTL